MLLYGLDFAFPCYVRSAHTLHSLLDLSCIIGANGCDVFRKLSGPALTYPFSPGVTRPQLWLKTLSGEQSKRLPSRSSDKATSKAANPMIREPLHEPLRTFWISGAQVWSSDLVSAARLAFKHIDRYTHNVKCFPSLQLP